MVTSVITSCSAKGWEQYGRRFLESFHQYWPTSIGLHIVSEDPLPIPKDMFGSRVVRFWDLLSGDYGSGAIKFLERHRYKPWVAGEACADIPTHVRPRWKATSGYFFRYDAYKFCRKVFAIELVAEHLRTGRALWVDSDTITFAPVPETMVSSVLPASVALSCLDRGPGYHSECGFVGYNLDHSATLHFIREFAKLYSEDKVFELAEWHDSWVFDWLRHKLVVPTYAIPHKSKSHPFINSELGRYMDHMKGKRKEKGRSYAVEQVNHKNIPYWQRH